LVNLKARRATPATVEGDSWLATWALLTALNARFDFALFDGLVML
jgi:hypothetical protein